MNNNNRGFKYEYDHYSRKFLETPTFLYYITTRGEVYRIRKAKNRRFQNYRYKEILSPLFNKEGIKCVVVMGESYQLKELSIKLFSWDTYDPKTQEIIHVDGNPDNCYITNLKIVKRKKQ